MSRGKFLSNLTITNSHIKRVRLELAWRRKGGTQSTHGHRVRMWPYRLDPLRPWLGILQSWRRTSLWSKYPVEGGYLWKRNNLDRSAFKIFVYKIYNISPVPLLILTQTAYSASQILMTFLNCMRISHWSTFHRIMYRRASSELL